jgi:hypothetical protein
MQKAGIAAGLAPQPLIAGYFMYAFLIVGSISSNRMTSASDRMSTWLLTLPI